MPFDLAVFGSRRAGKVIAAYPDIDTWVIGGHSLGGVMAAEFAADNLEVVDGLALWASYPAESTSLADSGLAVISIYGTRDGLSTPDKIEASIPLLPEDTIWVPIEGGNHAQFGDYGTQNGDLPALISPADQQAQIVDAMVEFFSSLTS
jgi:pimeloyl-ACP methyl ester carboxylesterase